MYQYIFPIVIKDERAAIETKNIYIEILEIFFSRNSKMGREIAGVHRCMRCFLLIWPFPE